MISVIIVDDMPKARSMLRMLLGDLEDVEVVADFSNGITAIEYLKSNPVDLMFLDIEMPEMDGLEVANIVAQIQEPPEIVFATAYAQYSMDAWGTDAISYIVKPYSREAIHSTIEKYRRQHPVIIPPEPRLKVQCFPLFNVFIDDAPVYFKNRKAKELLAFLVHNRGGWSENGDICANVLEEMDEELAKNNLRTYVKRLKTTLEGVGMGDMIEQHYGASRVDTTKFQCDYYRYLDGETQLFQGEYLKEYSWAEPALARMLHYRAQAENKS